MTRITRACLAGLLLALTAAALQNSPEASPATGRVSLIVVKESNGKPVKNAEVVLHLLDKSGKQKEEGLELKTHDDGKADTAGVPYGKVRVQVIAKGFRTYGEDYDLNQPNLEITIKLQKPVGQFSIYK